MGFQAQTMVSAPQFRDATAGLQKALASNQNRLLANDRLKQEAIAQAATNDFRQARLANDATKMQRDTELAKMNANNRLEDLQLRAEAQKRQDAYNTARLAAMDKSDKLAQQKWQYEQRRDNASDIASSLTPGVSKTTGFDVSADQRKALIDQETSSITLDSKATDSANTIGERLVKAQTALKDAEFKQNLLNRPGDEYGVNQLKAEALTLEKEAESANNRLIREYNPKFKASEDRVDQLIKDNKPTIKALKDYGVEVRAELFAEAEKRKGSPLDKYDKAAVDAQVAKYINEYKAELAGPDALKARLREYKGKSDIDTNSKISVKKTEGANTDSKNGIKTSEYVKAKGVVEKSAQFWSDDDAAEVLSAKALVKQYEGK